MLAILLYVAVYVVAGVFIAAVAVKKSKREDVSDGVRAILVIIWPAFFIVAVAVPLGALTRKVLK